MTRQPPVVTFVMEQHLGHRTFAENLRLSLPPDAAITARWVPVTYRSERAAPLFGVLPSSLESAWIGRSQVRAGIRSSEPDGVVFNTQVPAALGGALARSVPYVVITDVTPAQYDRMAEGYGHRPDKNPAVRAWKHRTNRRVFQNAAACIGWSAWVSGSFSADYGVPDENRHVIPPGVDTAVWQPRLDRPVDGTVTILFVGGDFERKGGKTLLTAFAQLPSNCRLVLVTTSAPSRLGPCSDRIEVIDDLQPNDRRLIELYATSDVFVLPSLAETFGIAAVEASASAMPVVASHVGAFDDIVDDGVTGILVAPSDSTALAGALRRLVDDPGLRRAFGGAARDRAVERFDSGTNAQRVLQVVHDAIR